MPGRDWFRPVSKAPPIDIFCAATAVVVVGVGVDIVCATVASSCRYFEFRSGRGSHLLAPEPRPLFVFTFNFLRQTARVRGCPGIALGRLIRGVRRRAP